MEVECPNCKRTIDLGQKCWWCGIDSTNDALNSIDYVLCTYCEQYTDNIENCEHCDQNPIHIHSTKIVIK